MGTVWGQGGFLGPLDSEGPISPGWGSAGREKEASGLESSVSLARLHMPQLYTQCGEKAGMLQGQRGCPFCTEHPDVGGRNEHSKI